MKFIRRLLSNWLSNYIIRENIGIGIIEEINFETVTSQFSYDTRNYNSKHIELLIEESKKSILDKVKDQIVIETSCDEFINPDKITVSLKLRTQKII
tara:strand:+ start:52934 stop:53224 length:291 start_codon:yes stop_codon:yes gene_type:complete